MQGLKALPFPLGEKRASTVTGLAGLLGEFFPCDTQYGKGVCRLVQLNNGSGVTSVAGEAVSFTSTEESDFDVDLTSAGDRCAGVFHNTQVNLDDNDYVLVVVEGDVGVSVGAAITEGHYVDTGNSGVAADGNTTLTDTANIGHALDAAAGAGTIPVRIRGRLLG